MRFRENSFLKKKKPYLVNPCALSLWCGSGHTSELFPHWCPCVLEEEEQFHWLLWRVEAPPATPTDR